MPGTKVQAIIQHWFWDPIPPWIKLNPEQLKAFQAMEEKYAEQMAQIQAAKQAEFSKMTGGSY